MTSQATCYYPDKSIATGFSLCNSTLAGPNSAGSACCTAGDVCTTGGYCLNSLYYPYRGACTDKSWNSDNCASECLDVAPSRTIAAVPCGDSGNFNDLFCCSLHATTSCCNATFGNVFGKPFAPTTLAATSVNDANGTSTAAVTTVTAASAGHSGSDATKVGVGVGVPLGVLLLLSLIFAAWTERRRRRDVGRVVRGAGQSGGQWGYEKAYAGSQAHGMDGLRHEAESGERRIPELGDGEVHEAGGVL